MVQSQARSDRNGELRVQPGNTAELKEFRDQLAGNLIRTKGRVRKLKPDKGFGFIAGDDGIDYFFHWSAVRKGSARDFRTFEQRDRVEFSPIKPPDKDWRAIEIEFVPE